MNFPQRKYGLLVEFQFKYISINFLQFDKPKKNFSKEFMLFISNSYSLNLYSINGRQPNVLQ